MPRSHIYSLLALSSLYLVNLEAETPAEEICGKAPRPMRITTRHIEGNGIGYNRGYTTIEGFLAPYQYDRWLPFVDVRGHVLNDGQLASNVGLGVRYKTDTRIWGLNTYYDYRNSNHYHYNQVAMGLESLGRLWDFRINGYLPVGAKNSHSYNWQSYALQGTNWILEGKREFAMKGFSSEAGFHVDHFPKFPLYFAAGPYYLQGKGDPAWGGQIRAALDISETLRVEGNTSYDNRFKWIGQEQVSLTVPFGYKKKVFKKNNQSCARSLCLENRALQKVDRFEIIAVSTEKRKAIAIDPATGQPWVLYSLGLSSNSLFRGNSENFLQLLNSAPQGAVFLAGGGIFDANDDGGPLGSGNLIGGRSFGPSDITNPDGYSLSASQQILGGNTPHRLSTQMGPIATSVISRVAGVFKNSGNGKIFTLNNGNKIQGVNLIGTGNSEGIGTRLGQVADGAVIKNVKMFLGSTRSDIAGIKGDFTNSLIQGNQITSGSIRGNVVGISASGAPLQGNQINVSSQLGSAAGIELSTSASSELNGASNNTITVSGGTDVYGLKVSFTEDNASADILGNTIRLQKNGNTYATGDAKGVWVDNPRDGSKAILNVNNITIDQNIGTASGVYVDNTGSMDLEILGSSKIQVVNLGDGTNTGTGIYIKPTGTFTNSEISKNNISIQTFVNYTISPPPSLGPDAYGINAPVSINGLTVDSNTINITRVGFGGVADGYGLALICNEASSTSTLTNNAITVAGDSKHPILGKAYGIHVDTNGKPSCSTTVDGGSINVTSGADATGVYVVPSSSGITTATLQNMEVLTVTSSAADAYGIHIEDVQDAAVSLIMDGFNTDINPALIKGYNSGYGINIGMSNQVHTMLIKYISIENRQGPATFYAIKGPLPTGSDSMIFALNFSPPYLNNYGIYLTANQQDSKISLKYNAVGASNVGIYILNPSDYTITCCNLISNRGSSSSYQVINESQTAIPVYDSGNSPAISYTGPYTRLTQACE